MDTWILAGQSNMQGFGLLSDPRRTMTTDDRVEHLTSSGEWAPGADPLQRLWESYTPVHQRFQRMGLIGADVGLTDDELAQRERERPREGAGLGMSFASRMADLTGNRVGLIPAAHGGSSLAQWAPTFGGEPAGSTSTLYGSMLDRVQRTRERKDVELRGVLWYQGESDANLTDAANYAERFDAWLTRLRLDLGEFELPLYAVQLGRFTGHEDPGFGVETAWDRVREAQRTLPSRSPATGVVSAVDLGLSDTIHISAPELERLGRRLANVASRGASGPDVLRVEFAGYAPNGLCLLTVACSGVTGSWQGTGFRGFSLTDANGVIVDRLRIVDAHPDSSNRLNIRVVTNVADPSALTGAHLAHGLGYDPDCRAVDEADLPLPAFAPQQVRFDQK